jgi:hypothetical protein
MDISLGLVEKHLNYKSKHKDISNDSQYESSICLYDFFCLNNIKICEKIKEKYNLTNKYHIIKSCSQIAFGEISEKNIHYNINHPNNNNHNNNHKYVLLEYNKLERLDFDDFLIKLTTPKLFIFHLLDSYEILLNSLLDLEKINVCFFNLSTTNIIFTQTYKPMLRNFNTSLLLDKCSDIDYFWQMIDKISDYTYKPIEIHVIFYLIKNNEDSLSFSAIDSISNNFVENMSILSLFSQEYRENYYKTSMDCLKKYINKPKSEIINQILLYSNTWDNYELSILYLHIFSNITRTFSLNDTLINKLTNTLSKNIGPDPTKRETLTKSIQVFDKLFCEFTDWNYIDEIPKAKMAKLHENLFE